MGPAVDPGQANVNEDKQTVRDVALHIGKGAAAVGGVVFPVLAFAPGVPASIQQLAIVKAAGVGALCGEAFVVGGSGMVLGIAYLLTNPGMGIRERPFLQQLKETTKDELWSALASVARGGGMGGAAFGGLMGLMEKFR